MSTIISDYLDNSLISIPTITTHAMIEQPEIIQIMKEINNIEFSILKEKTKGFFNNAISNEIDIIQVLLICSLMYKNNVFPTYIFDILTELGLSQGLTVQELKQNSESLIDLVLSKTRGGGQRGGQFDIIIKTLLKIAVICLAVYRDYFFYHASFQVVKKIKDEGTKAIDTVKLLTGDSEKMCNIEVPNRLIYFDEYFAGHFVSENVDLVKIYKISSCVANRWMDEVFISQEDKSRLQEKYSNALMLFEGQLVSVEDEQLMAQLQPIQENTANIFGELVLYDETQAQINIEKIKTTLEKYSRMTEFQLSNLLNPNLQKKPEKREKGSKFSFKFALDSFNILREEVSSFKEDIAFDLTTTVTRMIQDYAREQLIKIEDLQRESRRNLEDFVRVNTRLIQDILDFINLLPRILLLNTMAIGFILDFLQKLYKKVRRNPQLEIEYPSENLLEIEGPEEEKIDYVTIADGGGKPKRHRTRKNKNKKNKTKKNKKQKRNRQTKNKNKKH